VTAARAVPEALPPFVEALASTWGENLVSVVLFGSWARGQAREDSDVDQAKTRERHDAVIRELRLIGLPLSLPRFASPARQERTADQGPEGDGSYPLDDTPYRPNPRTPATTTARQPAEGRAGQRGHASCSDSQFTVRSRCSRYSAC
jgi:hypothetical protein